MAWKKHLWCWLVYFWWRSLLFSDCWSSECHRPGATSGSELFIAVLLRKSLPVSFCNRMYLIRLPSPIIHTFIPRHVWRQDQRSSSPRILWGNLFGGEKINKINKNPRIFAASQPGLGLGCLGCMVLLQAVGWGWWWFRGDWGTMGWKNIGRPEGRKREGLSVHRKNSKYIYIYDIYVCVFFNLIFFHVFRYSKCALFATGVLPGLFALPGSRPLHGCRKAPSGGKWSLSRKDPKYQWKITKIQPFFVFSFRWYFPSSLWLRVFHLKGAPHFHEMSCKMTCFTICGTLFWLRSWVEKVDTQVVGIEVCWAVWYLFWQLMTTGPEVAHQESRSHMLWNVFWAHSNWTAMEMAVKAQSWVRKQSVWNFKRSFLKLQR